MGKLFEDFNVGEVLVTRRRSVMEADIMQYAGLCWDTQREHTNAEFAKEGPFGQRIAQQQLGILFAHGLIASSRVLDTTLASVLRLSWNFFNPIKIGDTLHVEMRVLEKRDVPVEAVGLIIFQWETINQRSEVVNRCQRSTLVARRPAQEISRLERCPYIFKGLSELEPGQADVLPNTPKASAEIRQAPATQKAKVPGKGKYFEEFQPGEQMITEARTVTEADVINYTMLSWDTDPLHTDLVWGRSSIYGGLLAPILLPIVFANGLGATLGYLAGTNRGALGSWWEFVQPVKIGDTLHFREIVFAKKEAKDSDKGIITFGMEMINQGGIVVSRGQRSSLVARLTEAESKPWSFSFGTPKELAKDRQG
jgi:acyl dehydratase